MNKLQKYLDQGFKIVAVSFDEIKDGFMHQLITLSNKVDGMTVECEMELKIPIDKIESSFSPDNLFSIKSTGADRWTHFKSEYFDEYPLLSKALVNQ